MRPAPVLVAIILGCLAAPAWAKKVDSLQKLMESGRCGDVLTKVDDWEGKNQLGSEDADLRRIRAEAGYCIAKAKDTVPGWEEFLGRFKDWPQATAARIRLWDLAFAAAQSEGTSASMKAFIARYPESPYLDQARRQEEAWAFDDAAKAGSTQAIEAFLAAHPDSSMRAQAWESIVQNNAGIYLISPSGEPRKLEPVPVEGDTFVMPAGVPSSDVFPVVGVNLPGAGRGETSEWWALQAVQYDGDGVPRLVNIAPIGAELAQRIGAAPPGPEAGLLTLFPAAGAHTARVATTRSPLGLPGHCDGFARYAFVLRTPGIATQAFPFSVSCPDEEATTSPIGQLFALLDAAESGDRTLARQKWGAMLARSESEPLRAWLATAVGGDPWKALVDDRPAAGDWVVWTTQPDGSLLSHWLRAEDESTRVLAVRPGWAVLANGALRTTIGDPACARLFGSIGATLFCAADTVPHIVSFEGTPLPAEMPPEASFIAAGFSPAPGPDKVVAAGPRWAGEHLMGAWRVRTTVQADIVAPAPASWVGALAPTPALGRWLAANAGSSAFGAARVEANAASLYGAFVAR